MRRVGFQHPSAIIGEPAESRAATQDAGWYIHEDATIEALASVDSGTITMTRIDADAWVFKHAHIGHDAHVMEGAEVSTSAVVGGHCIIGPHAKVGINATILPWRTIGRRARIGAGAVVTKDVPPGEIWAGNPARKMEAKRSSSAPEPTTSSTPSLLATSTLPATVSVNSAQATPLSATDADAAWWAWVVSRDTSAKRTMLPKRPLGGFIEASAPHVAKNAPSLPSGYIGKCRTSERARQIADSGHWPHICDHCGYAELAGKQWDYGEWYGKGWICSTCAPNDDDGDGGW